MDELAEVAVRTGTVFRFAAPIQGTEDPAVVWLPGRMASHGTGASAWERGVYADPVITPAPEPFDPKGWP